MNQSNGSAQAVTCRSTAPSGQIPLPRVDPDIVDESASPAEGLTQRLVDRKLDELRRATKDIERSAD